jgi:hypothetical protein
MHTRIRIYLWRVNFILPFEINVVSLQYNNKNKHTMRRLHKVRVAVGSMIYVQIKHDLFKVFDCQNNYVGLANGIGEKIFCR